MVRVGVLVVFEVRVRILPSRSEMALCETKYTSTAQRRSDYSDFNFQTRLLSAHRP